MLPERKRKQRPETPAEPQVDPHRQQTISDVLATSQTKAASAHNKRAKTTESPAAPSQQNPPLTRKDMFVFNSNNNNNNNNMPPTNVVDLTSSPAASPSPRRPAQPRKPLYDSSTGTKKIFVKNFRTTKKDPTPTLNAIREKLDLAIARMFVAKKNDITLPKEESYQGIMNLCRYGFADELEEWFKNKTKTFLDQEMKRAITKKTAGQPSRVVLQTTVEAWNAWKESVFNIKSIFMYLNGHLKRKQAPQIEDICKDLFKTIILDTPEFKRGSVDGACELVQDARSGTVTEGNLDLFSGAVTLFHETGTYSKVFEPRFLELSQQWVQQHADACAAKMTLEEYVHECHNLLEKESDRCKLYNMPASTQRDLTALLEHHLIERQENTLTSQPGLGLLLDKNAVENIHALYTILQRRGSAAKLKAGFGKWINETGTKIVFDQKEIDSMVVRLLTLKKQLDYVWRRAFEGNDVLGHVLRDEFASFINKSEKTDAAWGTDNSKPGEMIAKYVDMLLRGGSKVIPSALSGVGSKKVDAEEDEEEEVDEDKEVDNQLDQVLDIFRFLHGKAVFEAFYKKDLARRLLMGRSASQHAEKSMLQRLNTECGAGFTQNLEQMFKDIELGKEEMASYDNILAERSEQSQVQLDVKVLSAAAWPTYEESPIIIPADVKNAEDKFEAYYKSKHSGRRLEWKHKLAQCIIKADFPLGKKEVVVSSFQAVILLHFNNVPDGEKVSYEQLKIVTGLPENELNRTLQSLACAKTRPLNKHPKSRDVSPTDSFSLNLDFQDKKIRIKINQIQLKETPQENKETHERVAQDRDFETQAAIVRIMKSRKKIGHASLVAEVIEATRKRGVLSVAAIKKTVDKLIEKDYMERTEEGMYEYVA
ncbi:cullin-4B [Aulographum hederae CBS 113979]|uniref:Cullin-4B n=1 Tax=Aulographum hederae CBS 113979 TaxID=1176131 RepID=A0A6G1HAE2_9PEZI|nr:cullin-4B [Aulographum hederae CBS 113979]